MHFNLLIHIFLHKHLNNIYRFFKTKNNQKFTNLCKKVEKGNLTNYLNIIIIP